MYKRGTKGWAKHYDFIIIDVLCLILSIVFVYAIRHNGANAFKSVTYASIIEIMIFVDFTLLLFMETLKNVLKRGYYKEFVATLKQTVVLFLVTTGILFTAKMGDEYSRFVVIGMAVMYLFLSYGTRLLWKHHLREKMKNDTGSTLLIMAGENLIADLIHEVKTNNYHRHQLVGLVLPTMEKDEIKNVPVVASYETIVDYATKNWVDEILLAIGPTETIPEGVVENLVGMGVTVHTYVEKRSEQLIAKQVFSNIGGMLVVSNSLNYMTPRQAFLKRTLDIIGALIGCFFTGIVFLFVAPKIKKESPGPVIFSQTRVGQNGKPFKFYKFRSMYLDAEDRKKELMEQNRIKDGMMFKVEFDPRIIGNRIDENGNRVTGIGEFIRRYSLDEFPQFWNVLKGDMSLVGTRPPTVDEYEKYKAQHKARLATKPGITGVWQISGRSNILDFDEVVRMDTEYINNWTMGMDIKILLKTILSVIKKEGSM